MATSDLLRRELLATTATLESTSKHEVHMVIGCDSATTVAAISKGTSVAMKHVRKNRQVSLASVHDACQGNTAHLTKIDTESNASAISTKPLDTILFEKLRAMLGVHSPDTVPELPNQTLIEFGLNSSKLRPP